MIYRLPRYFSPLFVAAALSLAGLPALRAQTQVVVPAQTQTTQLPADPTAPVQVAPVDPVTGQVVQPVAPVVTVQPAVPVQPVAPAEVLAPGEHVAEIELAVSHGSVQAYFGRAAKRETVGIGDVNISIKLPSTATVTKLASRDKTSDGSTRVTRDNPWNVRVRFSGPGRYVFNIVEWDNDPVVTAAVVRVDGQVMFSGRGSEEDINGWAEKNYAAGVAKSGTREIAFVLN